MVARSFVSSLMVIHSRSALAEKRIYTTDDLGKPKKGSLYIVNGKKVVF
jgi:hypothetical protein